MIIDNKGKLFGKISIIDIAVIIVIILSVLGGIVIYNSIENGEVSPSKTSLISKADALDDYCVEFRLQNVRDITLNALSSGDKVFFSSTGKYLGEIIAVKSQPYKDSLITTDGNLVFTEVPEKYELTIYVKAQCRQTETGIYAEDNTHLAAGESLTVITEKIKTSPEIQKISPLTEDLLNEIASSSIIDAQDSTNEN